MSTTSEPLDLGRWFAELDAPPDAARWQRLAEKALKGRPLSRLTRTVAEGVRLPPITHGAARDARPAGRSGPWQIRQQVRGPGLRTASRAAASEAAGGVEAVWFRLGRANRLGSAPDGSAEGAPALDVLTRDELAKLTAELDLTRTAVVFDGGSEPGPMLHALLDLAEDASDLRGGVLGDPLATLATEGELPRGIDAGFDALAASVTQVRTRAPGLRVVGLSGVCVAEAGGDAVLELAFVLAAFAESARRLAARGLSLTDWLPHAEVRLGLGRDVLVELAKLRALRRVWTRLLAACAVPEAPLFLHARMLDASLARRDAWTNLLRATQAGFVGAVGGADAITLLPHDAALGPSSAQARRIARNLHLLLREESHLDRVDDPAAGSGTLEHLTDALARQAWARLQAIEGAGGLVAVLRDGSFQADVSEQAAERAGRVRSRREVLVGVSRYPDLHGEPPATPAFDPQAHASSVRARWQAASEGRLIASDPGGEPLTVEPLKAFRPAAPWESLAERVQASGQAVFLAKVGPVAAHAGRAGFARDLFAAGGFAVLDGEPHDDPDAAATAFGISPARIACICGSDDDYERLVPTLARQLVGAGARSVLVAGRWPSSPEAWKQAGVSEVVHLGADVHGVLSRIADEVIS